ncbi:ABC transporter ATP-binding protein [Achromobacter aloeverae]
MTYLSFKGVEKHYANFRAVSEFNLDIERGELVAILGPSGCGKTTTLRMLAGFVSASKGEIFLDGKEITATPSYLRNIGMVFQGYALFPHMTVQQNVAFGLRMRKFPASEVSLRVRRALERVKLESLADRLPRQLSGGQQQRVALARAMAIDPAVLLLDEPLSALDASLRHDVRQEIRQLQKESGLTTVMVTHDQDEALSMADRLVIMNQGRIEQIGTPSQVYEEPANRFVAEFMGRSNFIEGTIVDEEHFRCAATQRTLQCDTRRFRPGSRALVSFRPERTRLEADTGTPDTGPGENRVPGRILSVTYLGQAIETNVAVDDRLTIKALVPNSDTDLARRLAPGLPVHIHWRSDAARLLPV